MIYIQTKQIWYTYRLLLKLFHKMHAWKTSLSFTNIKTSGPVNPYTCRHVLYKPPAVCKCTLKKQRKRSRGRKCLSDVKFFATELFRACRVFPVQHRLRPCRTEQLLQNKLSVETNCWAITATEDHRNCLRTFDWLGSISQHQHSLRVL